MKTGKRWTVVFAGCCIAAATTRSAHAGYEDDKNNQNLGSIERALEKSPKDLTLFDGKTLGPGVEGNKAYNLARGCEMASEAFDRYWPQVTPKGQASERGKKVFAQYQDLKPWCAALRTAVAAAADKAKANAAAAEKMQAERGAMCMNLQREAGTAVPGRAFTDVLDTIRGRQTPTQAEHVAEFRKQFEALVAVCKKPSYADAVTACKGQGIISSSVTNARYDQGDICAAAVDPQATLTKVVMAAFESKQGRDSSVADAAYLRGKEGWIPITDAIEYATYFQVADADKKKLTDEASGLFNAAGVPVPSDLSALWAKRQAWLDGLKSAVDQLAGEWKLDGGPCKGYACNLAKQGVTKYQKKAKIKSVVSNNEWKIVKNKVTSVPEYRYLSMHVVYQIPGEPYCQVRQMTANENYKGGSKYQKPTGTQWGYVRWQACK